MLVLNPAKMLNSHGDLADGSPSRHKVPGWVYVVGAPPRLAYLVAARPPFSGTNWALSDELLRDGSLAFDGQKTTEFEALYPIFLAVSRVIVGDHSLLVQVLQVVVASIGGVCLYRLTAALTGRPRIAGISAVLYASNPLLIREAVVHSESALLTTLLIAFAGAFVSATTAIGGAVAGRWLGLAVLTRTMVLPLVVLAIGVLIAGRRRWPAFALGLVTLILIAPLPIRNHTVNGSWWPTRGGLNFFEGNSIYTSALLPDHDLDILQEQAAALIAARLPDVDNWDPQRADRAIDDLLTREALAYIAEHPFRTLRQKALNVWYFFSPRLVPYRIATPETRIVIGTNGRITVEGEAARPAIEIVGYAVSSSFVLICALTGIYVRRQLLRRDAILWCIVITFVTVNAFFIPATRYRAPMEFVLLFYAAVALETGIVAAALRKCGTAQARVALRS